MATDREKAIIKVFKRQNFTLGPDTIAFISNICDQHEIPQEQLEVAIQYFVDEYARQDDATMKVSKSVLQRVYESFQSSQEDPLTAGDAYLDPETNLHVIDAFDLPLWCWSMEKKGFEKTAKQLSLTADADSRILALRNRLQIIRQVILRNEHFTASVLPSRDRDILLELKSTKDTLGRAGTDFLLFGMINHSKEGVIFLEDLDGRINLDISLFEQGSQHQQGGGFFTEGCMALVEGTYTDDEYLLVREIGHPPCERRETARSVHGHIDLLGRGFVTPLDEKNLAIRLREEHPNLAFFCISDLWLDYPETLDGLRRIFEACIENAFIPKVFIFCGNFCRKGLSHVDGKDIRHYQECFDVLADLIASFPMISRTAHFILIPGPLDLTLTPPTTFPRKPIMLPPTSKLKSKVPNVHLATNPCRIVFCGKEIVVFRDDLMARMMRNSILQHKALSGESLKRHLVQTIIDQCHLTPFSLEIQPTYWDFDHSLRLYPMPSTIVLADRYERYELTYEGCHVFNPGSFHGTSCGFSTYYPASGRSEPSELPSLSEQ